MIVAILVGSILYLPSQLTAEPPAPTFATTADFDAGTKDAPGDGNFGVETSSDNPGIAPDRLELASLRGDAFTFPDPDADTFKWNVPATCTFRSPTTIVRDISSGVLHLGANRGGDSTRVGVVASSTISGDIDVRIRFDEVTTQSQSGAFLQILNEPRCDWFQNPRTADGVIYEWNEGPADSNFVLRAFMINDGRQTRCGTATTLAVDPIHLRIGRVGTTWTWYYSGDGVTWTQDEQCVFTVTGGLYVSLLVADVRGGVTTRFELDNYHVAGGTVDPLGFRTSGDWTSPAFDVPSGMEIDHVEISGTFAGPSALDRTDIRKAGLVLETFESDNLLIVDPAGRVCGNDVSLRLYLVGDGAGTPGLTRVEVIYAASAYLAMSESVVVGSSSGLLEQCGSDDVAEAKTEALDAVSSIRLVDSETIATGTLVSGDGPPSPSDTDANDDVSVQYREGGTIVDLGAAPGSQTLGVGEADSGSFPACLDEDDGMECVWSEGLVSTEESFVPGSETIAAGAKVSGAFPAGIAASDDTRIEYQETGGAGGLVTPTEVDLRGDLGDNLNDNTRTVWRNPRGTQRSYVLYEDIDGLDLVYRWSTDGVAWSGKILVNSNTPANFEVAIHDSGADLKVFLVVVEGTSITYRRGSIADAADTIAWDSEALVATATKTLARALSASIVRTDAGRLVVAYATDVGSNRTTRLIGSDGDGAAPVWSGDVLWNDPSASTNNQNKDKVTFNMASFSATFPNSFLLAGHVQDAGSTSQYRHVSAVPTWDGSAFANVAQSIIRAPVEAADSLSCVIDSSDVAHCLVEDASDLFSAKSGTAGDDTWQPLVSVQPAAAESGKSTLSIDRTSSPNVLYAVYDHSASSTNLFYRTSPVTTISWGTEVTIPYPQDVLEVASGGRDHAGGIHIAGIRNPNALFYHRIASQITATEDTPPSSQAILKGTQDLGGSPGAYFQGTFVRKTDGPGLQAVPGVGFEGKALILWWTRQATFGTGVGHSAGIGLVASSSQQYAIAWADDDGLATSNSGRRSVAKGITILLDGTPTLDGEASFVGFTSNGFSVEWTTNPNPAQATVIHFIVLGFPVQDAFVGEFTGPSAGFTGSRSYTGVGFQGDLAIFLGSLQTSLGDSVGASMGFGAATGPSSRGASSLAIPDGTTTADTEEIQSNTKTLIMYNPGGADPAPDQQADISSFDPDGFTLTHSQTVTGDVLFWAMVLRGGSYDVDFLTRPTTTGLQAVSGLGFAPTGVLFWGTASAKPFGDQDPGAEWILGAGTETSGGVLEGVRWAGSNNAVSTTNAATHASAAKVIKDLSLSSHAMQNEADYLSTDEDGFTISWTTVQNEATQKWFWLAFGEDVFTFPACVESSNDERCIYREADQGVGDFEAEVKYSWSNTETWGIEWRLFVEGRQGVANAETIQVRIYGSDELALSSVVCSVVSTADALFDCGALTTDQLDAGAPDILFSDATQVGDAAQSSFELDRVYLRRTFSTTHAEVRYDWAGIPAGATAYELRVEGNRGDENILVQVLMAPSTWTTRLTIGSTSDAAQGHLLATEEFNGGAPAVRFIDANTADAVQSGFRLDDVRIVKIETTYALALQWDWTDSVTPSGPVTLEMRASAAGDLEPFSVEVYDSQDNDWRAAFLISGSTETLYSSGLATACSGAPDDCEVSTPYPGSVRVRFIDAAGADGLETSLHVDVGLVHAPFVASALDLTYEWTSLGYRSGEDLVVLDGRRSDEDILVQVWDWDASAWVTRLTIASTGDALLTHVLTDSEISPTFAVRIRFVGADDAVMDGSDSDLWLDYVAIEKREFRLEIRQHITGVVGGEALTLRIEARLGDTSENFDVYVWDSVLADWVLIFDSALATADQTLEHPLASSEISGGTVTLRFVDDLGAGDTNATSLLVDLLEVVPGA